MNNSYLCNPGIGRAGAHARRKGEGSRLFKGGAAKRGGFSLLELMIVVSLMGLLAVIAIPNFLASRTTAQRGACISNLHQIDSATEIWAIEEQKAADSPVTYSDISPYLRGSVVCPAGGVTFTKSYSLATVSDAPTCLIVPTTHLLMDEAGRPVRKKPKPHS